MMKFARPQALLYVPDGSDVATALARTTHLGIGAHADDLEFMAWHPITHCYGRDDAWFTAVTVSDGRGSPRDGRFSDYTDDQMRVVRLEEQKKAADIGCYGALLCLDYPSAVIRDRDDATLREELARIVATCDPREVYTHNPADRHDTHTAVCCAVIDALRGRYDGPLYGCEVWRSLDWLADVDKTKFDVSDGVALMERVMAVYESQIGGGKRYDLATTGRKRANATYLESHEVDEAGAMEYVLDMSDLLRGVPAPEFVAALVERFRRDVQTRLERYC